MFGRKKAKAEKRTFDAEHYRPVLRCSICNGEQVAGFKETGTGKFEEVMLIRNEKDLKEFLETYDVKREEIRREW